MVNLTTDHVLFKENMRRKKAHYTYAGRRRRFFWKLIRKYHTGGEFNSSAFSPPRLSPLPLPIVERALETKLLSMPGLNNDQQPDKVVETPAVPQHESPSIPRLKIARTPQDRTPRLARRKPWKAISTFVPKRVPTRLLSPTVTIQKPFAINNGSPSAVLRKQPIILENVKTKFKVCSLRRSFSSKIIKAL